MDADDFLVELEEVFEFLVFVKEEPELVLEKAEFCFVAILDHVFELQ